MLLLALLGICTLAQCLNLGIVKVVPGTGTMCHGGCSGHGVCESNGSGPRCKCDLGWGSEYDITLFRDPTCARRTCPAGEAWASAASLRPQSVNATAHELRECSNVGTCDYESGECVCPSRYSGVACERMKCPNDCSGHGQCMSMARLARYPTAQPLSPVYSNSTFGLYLGIDPSDGTFNRPPWEAEKVFGCVCDSSWPVGLTSGTTQQAEWHGPDCSLRRCPSGDDPFTTTVDETNCQGKAVPGVPNAIGRTGNKCHVDCANRGVCDSKLGSCACFKGFYGSACTLQSALSSGTSASVDTSLINDDRTMGRKARNRPDTVTGKGVDDAGQYFNDDL